MNYFAHGRRYTNQPYFLAGTAVPDWLSVVDRRMRLPSKRAAPALDDPDPRRAALAAGVMQHHHDDRWFHQTRAFAELSLGFAAALRAWLADDEGFRPSFLGHILVELLLDAELIREQPQQLDDYYAALESLDAAYVAEAINSLATRTNDRLAWLIPRFCSERFLYDYLEDAKLLRRLNHVMQRVGLPLLPAELIEFLPEARRQVRQRRDELLDPTAFAATAARAEPTSHPGAES